MDSIRKNIQTVVIITTTITVQAGIYFGNWLEEVAKETTRGFTAILYLIFSIAIPVLISGPIAEWLIKLMGRATFSKKLISKNHIDAYFVVEWWDKNNGLTYVGNELTRFLVDKDFFLKEFSINWNRNEPDPTNTIYVDYPLKHGEYVGKFEYLNHENHVKEAISNITFKNDSRNRPYRYSGNIYGIEDKEKYNELHVGSLINASDKKVAEMLRSKNDLQRREFLEEYEQNNKRKKGITKYQE